MISSRATVWSAKTQTPNGLRVTLIKKRNLQRDCSTGDQETKGPPALAPAGHSVPRWTIEGNRDPCKLTIKRRKTFESSENANLEIRLSKGRSLKTVAPTKSQRDSESSLARIKNWCTEQISASLPSTCYDNFLAADVVTMQASPKCVASETSLSGELFHLQPSPKDSGIDVSSPPRRFDEVHLADINGHSSAADVSVASPNSAVVTKKPSKTKIHFEKTFCVKRPTLEPTEGMSAKGINVKIVCSSSSQRPWNLRRRLSHSRKSSSGKLPVEEDNRLLLRFPTNAFKAELTGTVNKRINRTDCDQIGGEQMTISANIDSDCAIKMTSKCKSVQNKETEENTGKHCESKFVNSVCGHKIRSKNVKQKRLKTVQDADLRVDDNLKEGGDSIISKNGKVTKKNVITSAKLDDTIEKQTTVGQSDKNMNILDGDFSFTGAKASGNMKTYSRKASKQADNKIKLSNNKTLKRIGAVTELTESTDGHATGTFNNGRDVESSELFSDGHTNTTDGKCLDFSEGVGAKVGFRLSHRNRSLSHRGVDTGVESPPVASVVMVNCRDVPAKSVESVSVGENCSRTSSDLDDSVTKDENSAEKFSIKRSSRLAIGASVNTEINRLDRDCLTVELSLEDGGCFDKADCVTVHEVTKTNVSSASKSVQLRCSNRLTRSSAKNKLSAIFNSEIPSSEPPKSKDSTYPLDMSALNVVASESLTDIRHEMRKQTPCSKSEETPCSDLDDSADSKADDVATDGLRMHEDFHVKPFEFESDAKIAVDAFPNEGPKRSNSACIMKKRRAGSRNSASRRSFERLSNSKELWKLSPVEESLSTSAESETRNENTDQEDIVSLNFDRTENDVDESSSRHSGNREEATESSEFCRFSAKKSSEDILLSSERSFGEEVNALNRQNMTTCFSPSFRVSCSQETTRSHSESLSLQDAEASVDSENQFQSMVVPLELSRSAALSLKPDLKSRSVSIPTNNYIGEFARFVSIQHLDSFDSCSNEDDADLCTSAVKAEESPVFPLENDLHSSFCQSTLCDVGPQFNDDLTSIDSVQLRLHGSDLVKCEFDSARSCSSGECVVLSEDDKSTYGVSTINTEDLEISTFRFQASKSDTVVGSFRSHSGATDGISEESLTSQDFNADSIVSIERELTSLQSKVAQLIRAVFPGLSQVVPNEQHFLALPQFLDQVLGTVLGAADNDVQLQECHCDCQVNLCRNPLNCLKRLQSKVLRLIHFLLPSSDFEDVGADDVEPLVEAVTLANSARVQESPDDDSECFVCDDAHCSTS